MISVILPVLNGADTIKKSIESVRNQTYTDFELLIVDNGSTDETQEICLKFEKQDSRIKLLHCAERGVVAGRKLGLEMAQGEYVAFIDADDSYAPEMLQKMLEAVERHDADIASCGYINVYPDGRHDSSFPVTEGLLSSDQFFNCLFEGGTLGFLWNKLYRKTVLDECAHPENMEVCEDTFMNSSLMRSQRKIVILKECLYRYYVNPASVTHTLEKKVDDNGDWKYLVSYRRIRELFADDSEKANRIEKAEWWVIKLGVEELDGVGTQGQSAQKKLLLEMKQALKAVLRSDEGLKFKISFLKCYLMHCLKVREV